MTTPAPDTADANARMTLYCTFCGRSEHEVFFLIAGPMVFICDNCTGIAAGQLASRRGHSEPVLVDIDRVLTQPPPAVMTPGDIGLPAEGDTQ